MSDVISQMLVGAVSPKTRPIRRRAALPGFYREVTPETSPQAVQHLSLNYTPSVEAQTEGDRLQFCLLLCV